MPDTHAVFEIYPTTQGPKSLEELADRVGYLRAIKADIESEIKRLEETFRASGERAVEGSLYRIAVGADCVQSTIDRKAIEKDMGESWIAKYLRFTPRVGAFTCTAKTGRTKRAA